MKNKKWGILIIFAVIALIYVIISRPKDDIVAIEKLILKEIGRDHSVTLYHEIVIDNHSLVSYIQSKDDKYQAVEYAHFTLNDKGNYELLDRIEADRIYEVANAITLFEFSNLQEAAKDITTDPVSIDPNLFVLSNNPKLSRIDRTMENGEVEEKKIDTNPAILLYDNEDTDKNVEYKFYDKNGARIE